jgi:hypothetical protein
MAMDVADLLEVAGRLDAADVGSWAAGALGDVALAAEVLRNAVEAFSVAVLAEFHQRGAWAADGATSAAAWVRARSGSAGGDLRRRQRDGLALRQLPAASAACRSGHLSVTHQARLAACASRRPVLAARDEATLLAAAHELGADDFATAARHWCALAADEPDPHDPTGPAASDDAAVGAGREGWLHCSATLDGRYELSASLPAEQGRIVAAALDGRVNGLLRAARDGDPAAAGRPVAALRADALVDLVAQAMRRGPCDRSAPDRYRVGVLVRVDRDADQLDTAAALAVCDAPAYRAVLGAEREVLDIGRLTKRWPDAIRRAVTLRDRGCCFPGCDRPPSWTDVHHCRPWIPDGETKLDNGALLCRLHHTFIHANGWKIVIPRPRGRPETHRPDGTRYEVKRWPPLLGPPATNPDP